MMKQAFESSVSQTLLQKSPQQKVIIDEVQIILSYTEAGPANKL